MFKRKYGFTLGEVLLAMLIIGVIAVLSLPSLLKNVHEKSRMSLLKGTVASIGNVIQSELTKQRTTEITSTDIYKDPKAFIQKFDGAKSGEPFGKTYKRHSDSKVITDVLIPSDDSDNQAVLLLKNGVGIGIVNDKDNSKTSIVVDVTGADKPNMVGVDYFIMKVEWYDGEGYRAGDIAGYINGDADGEETASGLKDLCNAGNGAACFRMVELSSYEPRYLD